MAVIYANNAATTLASGITAGATSAVVSAGTGALFPSPTGTDYFYATLVDGSNNIEIVKCTARSVDTLTIVRAQEGTTARAYSTADKLELRTTAAGLNSKFDKVGGPLSGDLSFSANNLAVKLKDTSGGTPQLLCNASNNLILSATSTLGASRDVLSVQCHHDTAPATFLIPAAGLTPTAGDSSTLLATTAFVATSFAPLASPPLSGVPTAPTAALDTATTQLATTAFVDRMRDIPRTSVALDRGKVFAATTNTTIPTVATAGVAYSVYNDSPVTISLIQGTGLTLRLAGTTTTGDRTLAPRGMATIWFNATNEAIASGPGVT